MADKDLLAKKSDLLTKQDTLIAGANITIGQDGKTISAPSPTSITVTPIYQAGTLVAAILINGNTTNIYAPAQHGDLSNQNLATTFSASSIYTVGQYVIYEENLYKCIVAIDTAAAWDSTKWTRVLVTDELGQSGGDSANQNIANTYDATSTYNIGDYIIFDGNLYKCTTAVTTPGPFNLNNWTRCLITDEMGSGGGLDLPDNWNLNEHALTVNIYQELNELGWGVTNNLYYFDTAASFSLGDRTYTKNNATPALGAVVGQPGGSNRPIVLVSTDANATHYYWSGYRNDQDYTFTYLGQTWYYSGGNANYWGSPASGIQVIIDDTLTLEEAAKYLIDESGIYFKEDTFATMTEPGSGTLFAGGGEESDLSDATFKVKTTGEIYGTDYYKNGNKLERELTQAQYDALSSAEKHNGTIYFITDGESSGGGGSKIYYGTTAPDTNIGSNGDEYVIYNPTQSTLIALYVKINNDWLPLNIPENGGGSSIHNLAITEGFGSLNTTSAYETPME